MKLVATLALNGRDEELGQLVGSCINDSCGTKPQDTSAAKIKTHIESGKGIGERTILSIHEARGTKMRTRQIREAVASLKDSAEHDQIIAGEAAEAERASGY